MLIMSETPRDVRGLCGSWSRLCLSKAPKPTALLLPPLSSNPQHDLKKLSESSNIGQSTKGDNSNQPYATVRSDANHDIVIAVVAYCLKEARGKFRIYMLNIHISYSIHPECPHMYSHSLVSHHHSSLHFI